MRSQIVTCIAVWVSASTAHAGTAAARSSLGGGCSADTAAFTVRPSRHMADASTSDAKASDASCKDQVSNGAACAE